MLQIIFKISRQVKRKLMRQSKKIRCADTRQRYQIIILLAENRSPTDIRRTVKCARSMVYKTFNQFREEGEQGLKDQRLEAHPSKVTSDYLTTLLQLIPKSPRDYGWNRSTWTQELLTKQMKKLTGIELSRTYLGKMLRRLNIHRRRACPVLRLPIKGRKKRIEEIHRLVENMPHDETIFYQDEADVDLNPRIGSDYMLPNQQKKIPTPGVNEKRYIAGTLNIKTGNVTWTVEKRKNSKLFIDMLKDLLYRYRRYRVIHLILDNYIIHKSQETMRWMKKHGERLKLHFLPPYSPVENKIETLWKQLHDNITRNHQFPSMEKLMQSVEQFLEDVSPYPKSKFT